MTFLKHITGVVCLVTALCTAPSRETTTPSVGSVKEDIARLNTEMFFLEERIMSELELVKTSLRSELRGTIQFLVAQAVDEVLKGTSPIPTDQVKATDTTDESPSDSTTVHPTKQEDSQLPAQREKVETEPFLEQEESSSDRNNCTCSRCQAEDPQKALKELQECRMRSCRVEEKLRRLLSEMNETCSFDERLVGLNPPDRSTSETDAVSPSPPSSLPTGLVATTGRMPPKVNTSIFIAKTPLSERQCGQLIIETNSYEPYSYISWQIVTAVAYVKKLKRLLIGTYNPNSIIASKLHTHKVRTLREVESYGIAVDEERDAIFMTTRSPLASISRMTTRGRRYKVIIDLSTYDRHPLRIAVHPRDKRIFANTKDKIFTVGYDGRDFETLIRGRSMHGLTIDSTGNILFFNDDTKLIKMSVSRKLTKEVTTFGSSPWDLIYYKNTLYYSVAQYSDSGTIGLVNLMGYGKTLELHNITYNNYGYGLNICLIP